MTKEMSHGTGTKVGHVSLPSSWNEIYLYKVVTPYGLGSGISYGRWSGKIRVCRILDGR